MPRVVEPTDAAVAEAAERLRSGDVVVFPTETVYGLGADTLDPDAIAKVFAVKRRPADNPLIAHVTGAEAARAVAAQWDERCAELATRFWPGPLTLVLDRRENVPDVAVAGLTTVAVRCPRHDVARRLLQAFGGPVSAPSANRSGRVSPTSAAHVAADLGDVDDLLVLDGGRCEVGLESTVLDLTVPRPRILRPGSVTLLELREIVPDVVHEYVRVQDASPGTRLRHYAPRTPAEMLDRTQLAGKLADAGGPCFVLCFDGTDVPAPHRALEMPTGAGDYGRMLYAALRRADESGCERIFVEHPPETNETWRAIVDRLARATSPEPL